MTRREAIAALLAASGVRLPHALAAESDPTNVFTDGMKPGDARLGPPVTLDGYFPFQVPSSKEAWDARRTELREQVLVANGLWPMPEKTPLKPVVHGAMDRDGYVIEKVSFASMPGHYVTGNLYRPAGKIEGKRPGVLFAHGHWKDGRFHDAGERAAMASVANGGESDLERGRYFMQAIPITLARQGYIVFQYDMVGYADSTALTHREGFKDVQAELRLQSFLGLQTWNSIRALDFLLSLPEVEPSRIGMTGASGGGTQTFLLAAIDDRITAAFPAVMVSTAMQGGCVCENCSLLRVNTGNIELAALFAPKPLAMSAANDWTKELLTKGYPELQKLYELLGKPENVSAKAWLEYGHNYNQKAREFMYAWFAKHLLGKDEQPKEAPIRPVVPPTDLSVYDDKHPRPRDELGAVELRQKMTSASDEQMAKLAPTSPERLKAFRAVVGPALRAMVCTTWPTSREGFWANVTKTDTTIDGVNLVKGTYAWPGAKESVPFVIVIPDGERVRKGILWLHPEGKASLFPGGKASPVLKSLLAAGFAVSAPDLSGTGELAAIKPTVDDKYAGYTLGYNRSLLANRVHDAVTLLVNATADRNVQPVHLVGWGAMGPVAILAKAIAGDVIAKTAADMNGFRFEEIQRTDDPMLLPGAVKYGGMGSFIALCAPGETVIHNSKRSGIGNVSKAAYEAAGAADKLTIQGDKLEDAKVVQWLIG